MSSNLPPGGDSPGDQHDQPVAASSLEKETELRDLAEEPTALSEDETEAGTAATTPAAPTGDPEPGHLVSGRYRLEKKLGEGGMGTVYLALDEVYAGEFEDRNAHVALKFLNTKFSQHKISRIALQRETRKSQQLAHPNVVRVMHFDVHEDTPYMIMEFMRGQPMDEYMAARRGQAMSLDEAMPLIKGMANGLKYIHEEGLVHSDFKPGNVFVTESGVPKILDLGIARISETFEEEDHQTKFDVSSLGALTPTYASCEMFDGLPPGPKDDIYALALVIYELLTGRHPYERTPANRARGTGMKPPRISSLNRSRWKALEKGLAFERDARIESAEELYSALRGDKQRRALVTRSLVGATVVALLAAVGIGIFGVKPADPDEAYKTELMGISLDRPEPKPDDMARIDRWLSQGQAYIDIAADVFNQGDL
ncbi:MAG: serine/threonine protein kinase, partial [Halioglobus sp.]|nr:serine/threonine protein kinase [Halioglobus sp.]